MSGVLVLGALGVLWLRPAGGHSAETAARADVTGAARRGTVRVIATQPWGSGRIVVTRFEHERGGRRVTIAFLRDRGRGWTVDVTATNEADLKDVAVGSLLVAHSRGGAGQPMWSAVYGEVQEPRIAKVDIRWSDDTVTTAERRGDAYLTVRRGMHQSTTATFRTADGAVVAEVPTPTGGGTPSPEPTPSPVATATPAPG